MIINVVNWTRVLKNILTILLTLLFIFLAFKLAVFYIPFLIGFIISIMIEPIIKLISRKTKLLRKTSAIIVVVFIFIVLIGLISWGIISMIGEASNLLKSFNIYIEKSYSIIQKYINEIKIGSTNIPTEVFVFLENSVNNIIEYITTQTYNFLTSFLQGLTSLPIIGVYVVITILSTYFICTDRLYILDQLEHHFPKLWVKKFGIKLKKIIRSLGNYLKAEMTLIFISFVQILIRTLYF